jgi:hypothetical protein
LTVQKALVWFFFLKLQLNTFFFFLFYGKHFVFLWISFSLFFFLLGLWRMLLGDCKSTNTRTFKNPSLNLPWDPIGPSYGGKQAGTSKQAFCSFYCCSTRDGSKEEEGGEVMWIIWSSPSVTLKKLSIKTIDAAGTR